jgi:hypothetical protein
LGEPLDEDEAKSSDPSYHLLDSQIPSAIAIDIEELGSMGQGQVAIIW